MSAQPQTSSKPAEWLTQLQEYGLLRWHSGQTNMGLLLPILLNVNGWQGDILSLCDALPCSAHTIGVTDLLTVMAALGYSVHHERIQAGQIKAEDLPGLFIPRHSEGWRTGVVLRERGPFGLIWEDGREAHRDSLADTEGDFYTFERLKIGEEENDGHTPSWLGELIQRFRPLLWHAIALSLVMHLFTLAMPMFSMVVYDRIIPSHAPEMLPLLAAGVLLALGVEQLIRWMRIRLAGWIGARIGLLATASMFERLLFLPASLIEQASIPAQLARLRAFESVRDFITGPSFLILLEIPFLFIFILVIALLSGPVALVATGILCMQIALAFALRSRWKKLGREAAHAATLRQQLMMEMLENIGSVYAAGLSERMLARFQGLSWRAAKANYRFSLNTAILQHFSALVTVTAGLTTIAWCMVRIWDGYMTGGAMVATMIITWRVLYPLQAVCAAMPQLEQIRASLEQVSQLMAHAPEAHAAHVVLGEHPLKGRISIHNLGLRYDRKSDPVFLGLNCEIEAGEIVAIYGGNGSGKSSILRLLLGLYPPVMGNIRFDGTDHRQFDPRSLRRQIAYLPQLAQLFPGSIADNLRIHEPLAEEYRLRQALLWADAWDMVEQLPAGLNTRLGENGFFPSSGLSARIAMARLYLSNRPVILCDELPAQILNSVTGRHFRRFLDECRGKRTVIFVTHREDWLSAADKTIWLRPDARPSVTRGGQMAEKAG